MEKRIRESYSPQVLEEALQRYGISTDQCHELGGFESFVYEVTFQNKPAILKIPHASRRDQNMLLAEAEFINFLAQNGLTLPKVIFSPQGNLTESLTASDGQFLAVLYEKAPGRRPRGKDFSPILFRKMGEYLGQLHCISRQFQPQRAKRPHVIEESRPLLDNFLPQNQPIIREKATALLQQIEKLPSNQESCGLIHVDFHFGNFFWEPETETIQLFDFDDCQYSWFVHDIAMSIFYAIPMQYETAADEERAYAFIRPFLQGYCQQNPMDKQELQWIPLFLRLREIELYAAIHRSMDLDNLDPWCASFMKNRRQKIEAETPFFPLDIKRAFANE